MPDADFLYAKLKMAMLWLLCYFQNQLDLGRRHEPYRVSWVRRLGGRVRVDDPSTVALVVAEGYNILSV